MARDTETRSTTVFPQRGTTNEALGQGKDASSDNNRTHTGLEDHTNNDHRGDAHNPPRDEDPCLTLREHACDFEGKGCIKYVPQSDTGRTSE